MVPGFGKTPGNARRVGEDLPVPSKGISLKKGAWLIPPSMDCCRRQSAKGMKQEPCDFFASGVSIVLHPKSPMTPIIHMNIRYFEMETGRWWFGGGIDLTPHYVDRQQAKFFHEELKKVCDAYHPEFYPRFKEQADNYFYLKHRKETRGIGGIFFDYQDESSSGLKKDRLFEFVCAVGEAFAPIYLSLLKKDE